MYKSVKQYRFPGFDYSSSAFYFVTICTANRQKFFGSINNENMILSPLGKLAEEILKEIPNKFNEVFLDIYKLMPDHLHIIIMLQNSITNNEDHEFKSGILNNPMELNIPTLGKIIRWYKAQLSYEAHQRNYNFKWQDRYYDRIIRNEKEYYSIREYIRNNPRNR